MAGPKITVITATFNSEQYLEQTIASIQRQSYPSVEHIIVDGGSTDRTLEIVERYQRGIAKVISERDRGIYDAFNKGVQMSTGDVIHFLNSDDYYFDENVLEYVARAFIDEPHLAILYGDVMEFDETTGSYNWYGKPFTINMFRTGGMPSHSSIFMRRSLFQKHGPFDLRYRSASDFDFTVKCFLSDYDKSKYVTFPISVFRVGGMSSGLMTRKIGRREVMHIVQKHFGVRLVKLNYVSDVAEFYKSWVDLMVIRNKRISDALVSKGYRTVVVYGSRRLAMALIVDLQASGISVVAIADRDKRMLGRSIRGVEVVHPDWLKQNRKDFDAIVVSIEGSHDTRVIQDIRKLIEDSQKPIYSWKSMLELSQHLS